MRLSGHLQSVKLDSMTGLELWTEFCWRFKSSNARVSFVHEFEKCLVFNESGCDADTGTGARRPKAGDGSLHALVCGEAF